MMILGQQPQFTAIATNNTTVTQPELLVKKFLFFYPKDIIPQAAQVKKVSRRTSQFEAANTC